VHVTSGVTSGTGHMGRHAATGARPVPTRQNTGSAMMSGGPTRRTTAERSCRLSGRLSRPRSVPKLESSRGGSFEGVHAVDDSGLDHGLRARLGRGKAPSPRIHGATQSGMLGALVRMH
jgi:hypothetical protein